MLKIRFSEQVECNLTTSSSGPKSSRDFRETGRGIVTWCIFRYTLRAKQKTKGRHHQPIRRGHVTCLPWHLSSSGYVTEPMISYFHFNEASKSSLICDRVGEPTQAEAAILCDRLFCTNRSAKGNSALFQAICWLLDLKTFQNAEFKMQKRSHYQQFLRYASSLLLGNLCYCASLVTQMCVRV